MHFQTLLNIYKSIDSATFRFSFLPFNQVKGDFILILALASNNLSACEFFGFTTRGARHDCGTALNEATTIMGHRV